MRKIFRNRTFLLWSAFLTILFYQSILYAHDEGHYKVTSVIDGDTFELEDGKRVRLIGINTPEIGEKCSYQAKNRLEEFVLGKLVLLEKDVSETDKYGRLLRYAYVDGIFVNERLVYEGYAYAVEYPPDTTFAIQLEQAERSAYVNNRGCLWAESCPSGCIVHITNTGSKYHAAGCRYLSQSDIRICRDDAIRQGYSACSVCRGYCDGSGSSNDGGSGGGCFIVSVMNSN